MTREGTDDKRDTDDKIYAPAQERHISMHKHMRPHGRETSACTNICALIGEDYQNMQIYAPSQERIVRIYNYMRPHRRGLSEYISVCAIIGEDQQNMQIYAPTQERIISIYNHMHPHGGGLSDFAMIQPWIQFCSNDFAVVLGYLIIWFRISHPEPDNCMRNILLSWRVKHKNTFQRMMNGEECSS